MFGFFQNFDFFRQKVFIIRHMALANGNHFDSIFDVWMIGFCGDIDFRELTASNRFRLYCILVYSLRA